MATNVFLSCGRAFRPEQERFIVSIEGLLRDERLRPQTVGRSVFSYQRPLKFIDYVMRRCAGAIVIAYERTHIRDGADKRDSPHQSSLQNVSIATPWNQIEAALAYSLRLPLLVLIDHNIRNEGLLEPIGDWMVVRVNVEEEVGGQKEFLPIFRSWRKAVRGRALQMGWAPTQFPVGERIDDKEIATSDIASATSTSQ